jgi:hypothetical protein
MSYTLSVGSDGTATTAQVVWSVDGNTYRFRSDNNFLSWITTIFTVADALVGAENYRLLRPYPATQDTTLGLNGNTAGGRSALVGVTTGISNTAFGSQALSSNNGNNQTGVGFNSLKQSNAFNNTAVGSESGATLQGGSSNTLLGYNADVDSQGRNLCVALGVGAKSPAVDGSLSIGGTGGNAMTNLNVATAGGVAVGEFLNIYINGVQRKIQLLLPS